MKRVLSLRKKSTGFGQNWNQECWTRESRAQVANTRPVGQIRPSSLFYPPWHLVSTWWQHRALASLLRSSYIYTVLKLHSALWRQPWGWCSPWWKRVWHPWLEPIWEALSCVRSRKRLQLQTALVKGLGDGANAKAAWASESLVLLSLGNLWGALASKLLLKQTDPR